MTKYIPTTQERYIIDGKDKFNKTWGEIAEGYILKFKEYKSRNAVRCIYQRVKIKIGLGGAETRAKVESTTKIDNGGKIEYDGKNNTTTFDRIISLSHGTEITPENVMKAHGLDESLWKVVSYKSNYWQSQKQGGELLDLYQSKLTVMPIAQSELTFADIDAYFDKKDYAKDKLPIDCLNYSPDGEVLEVMLPDLHIGMLSWNKETGEDYDLKIVRERYFAAINDVVERCKGRKFKKILFVTLGDLLHVDNDKQTTTNGTFQQVEGRLAKMFECAEDMLIDGVTILGKIAPVELIYICGNHDRNTGYMLHRSVKNAFRNDKNVIVDTEPNPQKCRLVGRSLIGWVHGDMPRKNIADWLPKNHRELFALAKFIEIHSGHIHTYTAIEDGAIIVKTIPTLCASSYWEHQQGYSGGWKALMCNIWNPRTGLRDTWITNIA